MLSIGKLVSGAEDYYLRSVAKGAEEYYLGAGEAPGTWLGAGCPALGVSGTVGSAQLRMVKASTYSWVRTEHLLSQIERTVRGAAYRLCALAMEDGDVEQASWALLQGLMVDPFDRKPWELYLSSAAATRRPALEQAWKEAKGALGVDGRIWPGWWRACAEGPFEGSCAVEGDRDGK